MALDRRTFLATTAAATTVGFYPAHAAAHAPRTRETITAFMADPDKVAALKRGVGVMKSRKPSDPTSWFFQSATHAVPASWVAAAAATDPDVQAIADDGRIWNQCPHAAQPRSEFGGWHRAYCYHFENILRDAAGEPDLMLPYWRYEDPAQRRLPAIFNDPQADASGNPTNPLFEFMRDDRLKAGGQLTDSSVSNGDMNDKSEYFGKADLSETNFAGAPVGVGAATGSLEALPHNRMHGALGGTVTLRDGTRARGYMASVPTAAFDPIFWVHHTNVDRLWTLWDCNVGKTWGDVPTANWFDDAPWVFFAPDGSEVQETRRFYIESGVLPVTYDDKPGGCDPLSARIPAEVLMAAAEATPEAESLFLAADTTIAEGVGHGMLSLESPSTATLALPPAAEAGPLVEAAGAGTSRIFLDLINIDFETAPSVLYSVYVNPESDADLTPESPAYVGSLDFFDLSAQQWHDHGGMAMEDGLSASFDITDRVAGMTGVSDLDVRIVAEEQVTLEGAQHESGQVQVGRMRLREVN